MTETKTKQGFFNRFLNAVEFIGNKLPNPFMLFVYLTLIVMLASWLMSRQGLSVVHPCRLKTSFPAKAWNTC